MKMQIKKLIYTTTLLALSTSCGKYVAPEAKAPKKAVELKVQSIQSFSLENHSTQADTFTFFFFPRLGSMNWNSDVFKSTDSDDVKLANIVQRVLNLSAKIDDGDKETYKLVLENKQIQKQMEENSCGVDNGDFSEDFDLGDGNKSEETTSSLCAELEERLYANMAQADQLSSVMKAEYLRGIQQAVDNVTFEEGEGELLKVGEFENWQEYGDANDYIFDLTDPKNPDIYMPTLGKYKNSYSSREKEIYDIKLGASQFDPKTAMLYFKMKEKGENGKFTGFVLEAELEKVNFAGKIRFTGDVFKKNRKGKIVQHGVMKFELAENEVIDMGDDQ